MNNWSVLETIEKDEVINSNFQIRDYIDSFTTYEDILNCYRYLVVTGYDLKKVKVLMTLKNSSDVNLLLDLLDNPIFFANRLVLKHELEESKDSQHNILTSYLKLACDERYNLDEELISNILKVKDASKVVKFINREDFEVFESEFRELLINNRKLGGNYAFAKERRMELARKLTRLEKRELECLGIRGVEFTEKSNHQDIRIINNDEFKKLITVCMQNYEYRSVYKKLYVLLNFEHFRVMNKTLTDEARVYSKKYDLNKSHGRKRYNELMNYVNNYGEHVNKRVEQQ